MLTKFNVLANKQNKFLDEFGNYKSLSSFKAGDYIIDGDGRQSKITNIKLSKYLKECYTINTENWYEPIYLIDNQISNYQKKVYFNRLNTSRSWYSTPDKNFIITYFFLNMIEYKITNRKLCFFTTNFITRNKVFIHFKKLFFNSDIYTIDLNVFIDLSKEDKKYLKTITGIKNNMEIYTNNKTLFCECLAVVTTDFNVTKGFISQEFANLLYIIKMLYKNNLLIFNDTKTNRLMFKIINSNLKERNIISIKYIGFRHTVEISLETKSKYLLLNNGIIRCS